MHETTRDRDLAIEADPQFVQLVRERTRLGWALTILILLIYFGFILLIAFAPVWLGTSLAGGVTSIGIPLGVGVILSAFLLTGFYIQRANSRFDVLTEQILKRYQ